MKTFKPISIQRQNGAATLAITIIILLLMSIGMVVTTRGTSIDTKIIANEIRSKQAFANAQAGIEYILAGIESQSPNIDFLCATDTRTNFGFTVQFLDGLRNPIDPLDCEKIPFSITTLQRVRSWGYSPDGESVRILESEIDLTYTWQNSHRSLTSGGPPGITALVSRGNVNFQGTAETASCNISGNPPICTDLARPGNVSGNIDGILVRAGGNISRGSNAIPMGDDNFDRNNSTLAGLSAEDFFRTYVGNGSTSKADFINNAYHFQTGRNADNSSNTNPLIYVNGPLSLTGGVIGSPSNPVVLFVNGNINLTGNVIIWGTVYMTGSSFGSGNSKIFGALLGEQNVSMTGNGSIFFNSSISRPGKIDPDRTLSSIQTREANVRMNGWRELVLGGV